MPASESSSSSSSSSESSAPSSPVEPKKTSQTSSRATEASKKASNSSLEEQKLSQRFSKSPPSSPEAKAKLPGKGRKQSDTSAKSHKASTSLSSSPEASSKVPKSPSSSPEAPAKVLNPPSIGHRESAISTKTHDGSRSPSSSPEAPAKVPKSPPEELELTNSSEPPKNLSPSASKDGEPPIIKPESTQKHKPPLCHEDSEKGIAHPKESSEPQKASAPPSGPVAAILSRPHRSSFKSSLQVMLKRQEHELEKSIEYKDKLERGELDEDEDEGAGTKEAIRGNQERRGSEGKLVEEKGKEKTKDVDERVTREESKKYKSMKGKPKEDEVVKEKMKEKEEKKAQEETEMGRKKEAEREERAKKEEKKMKIREEEKKERERQVKRKEEEEKERERQVKRKEEEEKERERQLKRKEEEEKEREKQMKRKGKEEEVEKRKREEEKKKAEAIREEKKTKEERKESVKAVKSAAKEEKFHGSLYMKRKRAFNPWKEYYFVLDGRLLTYYSSKQQYDDLSGMKGSLDLTLGEEVQERKPGFLKTHHPFCLTRRNLSSIHLAATTKEERHRWLEILATAIRPKRISSHSSDRTLHSSAAAADPTAKSSTLPSNVKDINSYSSCSSDDDDDDDDDDDEEEEEEEEDVKKVKKEKEEEEPKLTKKGLKNEKEEKKEEEEEEEEKKEEEPELIKPKKVMKVPIGLPMGRVNLGEVKLKKLEKKETKEDQQTTFTAAAATHVTQDDTRETSPPGELFGVVLKKTKKPEEEKEKEAPKDTTSNPPFARRPSKQPVIPLNSGKLLAIPTAKSPKTSPATQKRQTPERRKSPSPSLPISKSVQALTKSADEVKATQANAAASAPPAAASTATLTSSAVGGDKSNIKLCHAQTIEVKYNNVEVMEEAEEVLEVKTTKREEEEAEKQDVTKSKGMGVESRKKDAAGKEAERQEAVKGAEEEQNIREDTAAAGGDAHRGDEAAAKTRSQDPLMGLDDEDAVRGDQEANKDTQERSEKPDEGLQKVRDKKTATEAPAENQTREDSNGRAASPSPEAQSVPSPLTPPASPASSQASAASGRSSPSSSPAAPHSKPSSSSSEPPPSSPKSIPSSLKSPSKEEEGSTEAWPLEAGRHRTDTSESTTSSNTESCEKKPGKLHRLKKKLKSSASFRKEKEEPASPKEPRKRRGSNSLSGLLAGKKSGSKRLAEEPQPHASQGDATSKQPASPHHTVTAAPHQTALALSEPPPAEAPLPTDQGLPRVKLQEAHPNPPQRAKDDQLTQIDSALAQMDSALAEMDGSLVTQLSAGDAAASRLGSSSGGEASSDTHNYLSVDGVNNQPPSLPKKTRVRAKSPNHDVPRNNRPVPNIQLMALGYEDEPSQTVDGYITEEQIEELLKAKENKSKRKQSLSRTQALLSVPDSKCESLPAATSSPATEEVSPRRPTFSSFSSVESEELMPVTNFLGAQRSSSSSGSLQGVRKSLEADVDEHTSLTASDSGESLSPEAENPMEHQWRAPRPTDAITTKNRLSLTSPEFTVQEEEGLSSPETTKARPPCPGDDDKVEAGAKAGAKEEEDADSEAEQENFFPVVGGDVQMRHPPAHLAAALDMHKGELRSSGIVSLKEYLMTHEKDLDEVKSGISRLGHSAAVEKLKQASSEQ